MPDRLLTLLGAPLALAAGFGAADHVIAHGVDTRYRIGGEPVEDRMYDFGTRGATRLDVKSITTLDAGAALAPLLGAALGPGAARTLERVPPLVVVGDSRTPARLASVLRVGHAGVAFALLVLLVRGARGLWRASRRRAARPAAGPPGVGSLRPGTG